MGPIMFLRHGMINPFIALKFSKISPHPHAGKLLIVLLFLLYEQIIKLVLILIVPFWILIILIFVSISFLFNLK